jgi:hypothetical protein
MEPWVISVGNFRKHGKVNGFRDLGCRKYVLLGAQALETDIKQGGRQPQRKPPTMTKLATQGKSVVSWFKHSRVWPHMMVTRILILTRADFWPSPQRQTNSAA